ncbi:MAG: hypothetical protein JXB62_14170 [Pirellulales bacterium]|nr:hypothetical protein [Pirellulales bacterium]
MLADPTTGGTMREAACRRLGARGVRLDCLHQLPVGLFVEAAAIRAKLRQAGFGAAEIRASKLLADQRLPGRLVGPIRDRGGRIVGFWARDVSDTAGKDLFLNRDWRVQVAVIGLHEAFRAGAGGELVLVEDVLDALALQSRGLDNVAAIGGASRNMSARRWQRLAAMGVPRVTLALPRETTSYGRLPAVLKSAFCATAAPELRLVPSDVLGLGRNHGDATCTLEQESLRIAVKQHCMHAYRWQALAILHRHRTPPEWSPAARRAALHEAINFYVSANRGDTAQLDAHFVPPIVEGLKLDRREPVEPETVASKVPGAGWCELHRCVETECFCFD